MSAKNKLSENRILSILDIEKQDVVGKKVRDSLAEKVANARETDRKIKYLQEQLRIAEKNSRMVNLEIEVYLLKNGVENRAFKKSPIDTVDIEDSGEAYSQAHIQTLVDLVNEIKAQVNLMNS